MQGFLGIAFMVGPLHIWLGLLTVASKLPNQGPHHNFLDKKANALLQYNNLIFKNIIEAPPTLIKERTKEKGQSPYNSGDFRKKKLKKETRNQWSTSPGI